LGLPREDVKQADAAQLTRCPGGAVQCSERGWLGADVVPDSGGDGRHVFGPSASLPRRDRRDRLPIAHIAGPNPLVVQHQGLRALAMQNLGFAWYWS
jgi:hypothetical protein